MLVWLSPQTMVMPGRESFFRSDNVHNALMLVTERVHRNAVVVAVLAEDIQLLRRHRIRDWNDAKLISRRRRRAVIHCANREIGTPHRQPTLAQHRESLRRSHLVHEMQVDIQHRRRILALVPHGMGVPYLLKQCARFSVFGHLLLLYSFGGPPP